MKPPKPKGTQRWQLPYTPPPPSERQQMVTAAELPSGSGEVLVIDAIDVYEREVADSGNPAEKDPVYLKKLQEHPCRGCPNLLLQRPAWSAELPKRPACQMMPTYAPDRDGARRVYRETWDRCPLHGVTSITQLLARQERRVERLEQQVREQEGRIQELEGQGPPSSRGPW